MTQEEITRELARQDEEWAAVRAALEGAGHELTVSPEWLEQFHEACTAMSAASAQPIMCGAIRG